LVRGETGTGKELAVRAIHSLSPRRNAPFVAINCSAIPDTLLESELFGYEEGTFTGAKSGGKAGQFEFANGGTIFLDEIGDMPLHLQAKMLRVLQDKVVQRVGGHHSIQLDIRVIAATNQDLESKIEQKEFREDLYYRLNVIPLMIPPLRKRSMDILPLTSFFLSRFNKLLDKDISEISEEFKTAIVQYDWPGNIRELQNAIEYAINIENNNVLTKESLPPKIQNWIKTNSVDEELNLDSRIVELEREMMLKVLQIHGADAEGVIKVAETLGISRSTLYRKAKRAGIHIPNIK
jgi:transcriptional regulator with PAS, ATPase and Fis domain